MDYDKVISVHTIICEQFFFNRKNVEVPAGNFDDDLEPGELVYEIFREVIATSVIQLSETTYAIELLSENDDLYLTPIIEYFKLQKGDIISKSSASIVQQVRKRPLEIGTSIAPLNENWWGTLGCFVKDVNSGEDYVLSNHHVLFSELGYKDNFIAQPAPCHGGSNNDAIGLYVRSLAPDPSAVNDFDAAVAGPISAQISRLIPKLNVSAKTLASASIGMKVYKIGATTGKTFGVVKSIISSIKVEKANGDILDYQNQIEINGTAEDFSTPDNFSLGGDSGSIIFDYDSNMIVGLLHCGNGGIYSFANKIEPLFNKLEISL